MSWKSFFFDGNKWCGVVDSPQTMIKLLQSYDLRDVLKAKIAPVAEIKHLPRGYHFGAANVRTGELRSFGFRREHTGRLTLAEWAKDNGINLVAALPS